ncbi:MAG TPA: DUF1127 domain-containing protein, partial [Stellaceae bacterium]|nr:DUF1127 domain-containing protein [Stellaceae bacterium]
MTRLSDNEKVMLAQAKTQAVITRNTNIDSVSGAFKAIATAAVRPIRRALVARQLQKLDDRLLADIGLQRWQIEIVADNAVGGPRLSFPAAVAQLVTLLVKRFRLWREKRIAYRELMALDERMLRDIGLSRGDIPAVIAGINPLAADAADSADPLDALRRWNRSRSAAKTLNGLDSRMLNDMGFVRGDIDWVAEELAVRSLNPA